MAIQEIFAAVPAFGESEQGNRILSSPMARFRREMMIFALCLGAAFVCAFAFVAMLQLSLPPTDLDYGRLSLSGLLADHIMLDESLLGGFIFGCMSFPFAYFSLRDLRLLTTAPFVFGAVLAEIVLITPFFGWPGFFGAVPTLAWALLFCRSSGWRGFVRKA
jgi:hypothetical protein